ncbi:MAG: hypothetical protein K0S70_133 [Microbacterium sp.]|jgi:hypothetical protein|nr:hypothetical protein [Microbacterium sp.]
MPYPTAEDILRIIAERADLERNDDGTFTARTHDQQFLVEIKVHDVTGS